MKQINIKIILLMLALTSNSNIIFAQFGGGNGTEQSPYLIRSKEHIEELAYFVKAGCQTFECSTHNKYFKLMNDITDSVRCVIGDGYWSGNNTIKWYNVFCSANFDGQGHKITLAIVSDGHAALFGSVQHSTIKNLRVDGYVKKIGNNGIKGWTLNDASYAASGIVGFAFNTDISNCVNYANIYINYPGGASVGGIVGEFSAIYKNYILDCINFGNIKVDYEGMFQRHVVGGIVGTIHHYYSFPITNCINFGTLKYHLKYYEYGHYDNPGLGGILGKYVYGNAAPSSAKANSVTLEIKKCINLGFIDGPGGGIVGTLVKPKEGFSKDYSITKLKIKDCINAGFISAGFINNYESAGGIVGSTVYSYIIQLGQSNLITIENCINTGVLGNKPTNSGIANID